MVCFFMYILIHISYDLFYIPYTLFFVRFFYKNLDDNRRKANAACSIVRITDGLSSRQIQPLGVPSDMNGPSSALIAIAPMASTAELYLV